MTEINDSIFALLNLIKDPKKYEDKFAELKALELAIEEKSSVANKAIANSNQTLSEASEKLRTAQEFSKNVSEQEAKLKKNAEALSIRESTLKSRESIANAKVAEASHIYDVKMTQLMSLEANLKERENRVIQEEARLTALGSNLDAKHKQLRQLLD